MKKLFCLPMCVAIATALASCVTPPPHPSEPSDAVPLHLVIEQVEAALGEYQANRGVGDYALPRLSTAQFDFTVTTTTTVESTADLCIFKLGGSHENDLVNEVTYTYSVPKLQSKALIGRCSFPAAKQVDTDRYHSQVYDYMENSKWIGVQEEKPIDAEYSSDRRQNGSSP
jgi:hypothetical protein